MTTTGIGIYEHSSRDAIGEERVRIILDNLPPEYFGGSAVSLTTWWTDNVARRRLPTLMRWRADTFVGRLDDENLFLHADGKGELAANTNTGNITIECSAVRAYWASCEVREPACPLWLVDGELKGQTPKWLFKRGRHRDGRETIRGSGTPYIVAPIDALVGLDDLFEMMVKPLRTVRDQARDQCRCRPGGRCPA